MNTRFVIVAIAILFAAAVPFTIFGAPSFAQSAPTSPAPSPPPGPGSLPGLPPGAGQVINDVIQNVTGRLTGAFGYNPNRAYGTVTYFRRFSMQVQMQLDKYRDVHLHQGTVINPRGWTIQPGEQVDVYGHPNPDGSLEADTIVVHH